jgi:UDP:flavonoid glycosyltransferase YjiC (YdhE family)
MRMLFAAPPAVGHILPLLPLANQARAAGHAVTFATGLAMLQTCIDAGFEADRAGPDDTSEIAKQAAIDKPAPGIWRHYAITSFFAGRHLEPRLAGLEAACDARKPDLIVHDTIEFAAPIAAAKRGIPLVTSGFGPMLRFDLAEAARGAAEPVWQSRGLSAPRWAGLFRDLYVDPCPPSLQVPEISQLPAVVRLGPGADGVVKTPSWIRDVRAPLIYVTFGTLYNRDKAKITEVLAALAGLPVEVVATVGNTNDPADFGPQPATTRIFRFIPQAELLPHCSAGVVHGGSGTMLGALSFGVPMVMLPQGADQFYNVERAVASGVAIGVLPAEASAATIAAALTRLLAELSFRDRAKAVAAEMATMPGPSDVLRRIEALVA